MATGQIATSILHATDFSASSERAFDHGLALAIRTGAAFTVVHVAPHSIDETEWTHFPAVRATLERWGLLAEGSRRSDVATRLGIDVDKLSIVNRQPLAPIVDVISSRGVGLVVLATHGRDGLPRWLHPSVAEPIARIARVQTLFVPNQARGFVSWESGEVSLRRILLPVDSRPSPLFAMRAAAQMARLAETTPPIEVTALHVGKPETLSALALLPDPLLNWQPLSAQGNVVETVLQAAINQDADLIVMPTHGHDGILDALRGNTTEQILRHAPCPVLAVPAE